MVNGSDKVKSMTRNPSDPSVRWHAGVMNNGLVFGAVYHSVTRAPRFLCYFVGRVVAWMSYRLMREGTSALLDNLRVICPNASEAELCRLAHLTYQSYVRDTIDFIRSLAMSRKDMLKVVAQEGTDRFDELLAKGNGVIAVNGHFGNWEIGGVALRLLRGAPLTVVGKPEVSPVVMQFRRRMRESLGIATLEIGQMLGAALQIRRLLAENGVVALLLDRHLGRDRVEVTFFDRRTWFLRTPALIASLSGAPFLPCYMIRQPDDRFLVACGAPIWVDAALEPEEGVRKATQAFATDLEGRIRAHPHLWYQFYPYWKTQDAS
jgi:lauroyl/myristoyl acyltransferase